jgi:hypothetical protein
VSSKKVIIMSSQTNPLGENVNTQMTVSQGDIRSLAATIETFRTLGGIVVLEATTKSHTEKIEQLTQWVSAIPNMEKDVERDREDLNELGKRRDKVLNELGNRLEKDINELGKRQTKELNELGIRLGKDIDDLKNVAHTADKLFRIFLGALVVILTVLEPPLMIYLYHHVTIAFHP